jgi:hypothetical protein
MPAAWAADSACAELVNHPMRAGNSVGICQIGRQIRTRSCFKIPLPAVRVVRIGVRARGDAVRGDEAQAAGAVLDTALGEVTDVAHGVHTAVASRLFGLIGRPA